MITSILEQADSRVDDQSIRDIVASRMQMVRNLVREKGLNVPEEMLVSTFRECRDAWMNEDFPDWVSTNRLYPGLAEALRGTKVPIFIITTREHIITQSILKAFGVILPDDHVFGQVAPDDKWSILTRLTDQFPKDQHPICFVDDRYETLASMIPKTEEQSIQLFLAGWGFTVNEKRREANSLSNPIKLMDLEQLKGVLRKTSDS